MKTGVYEVDLIARKRRSSDLEERGRQTINEFSLKASTNFSDDDVLIITDESGISYKTTIADLRNSGQAYNVRNYGAVGDGVTNDSVAIQAAVNAAELVGGTVYFQPVSDGNSYVFENVEISDGVTIAGAGCGFNPLLAKCVDFGFDLQRGSILKGVSTSSVLFQARKSLEKFGTFTSTGSGQTLTATGFTPVNGEIVGVKGTDLPAPLATGVNYTVVNASGSTFGLDAGSGTITYSDAGTGTHSIKKEYPPIGLLSFDNLGVKECATLLDAGTTDQSSVGMLSFRNILGSDTEGWFLDITNPQNVEQHGAFFLSHTKYGLRFTSDHDACAPGHITMMRPKIKLKTIGGGGVADYAERYAFWFRVIDGSATGDIAEFLDAVSIQRAMVYAYGTIPSDTVAVQIDGASGKTVNQPMIELAPDGQFNYPMRLNYTSFADIKLYEWESDGTWGLTDVIESVDTGADTLTMTGHGYENGDLVGIESSASDPPAGLTEDTDYYIVGAATDTVQLAATSGGAAINITDAGSGTLTLYERNPASIVATHMGNGTITSYGLNVFDMDTNSTYMLNGFVKDNGFKGNLPLGGMFYDPTSLKFHSTFKRDRAGMVYDGTTNSYGVMSGLTSGINDQDTWTPFRVMGRRDTEGNFRRSTSLSLAGAPQRLGYWEFDNSTDITVTLTAVGNGTNQIPCGVMCHFKNHAGTNTITISGSGADTIATAANYVLPATAGASVSLMSNGYDGWSVVGHYP